MAQRLSNIVVHCSDSPWGSASEIRRWHLEKGWRDIGYHFVILNGWIRPDFYIEEMDGCIETGRQLDGDHIVDDNEIGAHALGYNAKSAGICLIGENGFSALQIGSLLKLLRRLEKLYMIENTAVLGHYETENAGGKTCPNIDMNHVRYMLSILKGGVVT